MHPETILALQAGTGDVFFTHQASFTALPQSLLSRRHNPQCAWHSALGCLALLAVMLKYCLHILHLLSVLRHSWRVDLDEWWIHIKNITALGPDFAWQLAPTTMRGWCQWQLVLPSFLCTIYPHYSSTTSFTPYIPPELGMGSVRLFV